MPGETDPKGDGVYCAVDDGGGLQLAQYEDLKIVSCVRAVVNRRAVGPGLPSLRHRYGRECPRLESI